MPLILHPSIHILNNEALTEKPSLALCPLLCLIATMQQFSLCHCLYVFVCLYIMHVWRHFSMTMQPGNCQCYELHLLNIWIKIDYSKWVQKFFKHPIAATILSINMFIHHKNSLFRHNAMLTHGFALSIWISKPFYITRCARNYNFGISFISVQYSYRKLNMMRIGEKNQTWLLLYGTVKWNAICITYLSSFCETK